MKSLEGSEKFTIFAASNRLDGGLSADPLELLCLA